MLRFVLNLCRPPSLRSGLTRDRRGRFRDPRFASFLAETNRKTLDTDLQDAVVRGRRLVRRLLWVLAAGGGAWVVLESARALTLF